LIGWRGLQWVNHAFATKFGWGGREDFLDRRYLERLASPLAENQELRQQIWNAFRDWTRDGESPLPWPWIYGDSTSLPPISVRQHLMLSGTQMRLLERWKDGDFDPDLELATEPPRRIEDVPLSEQPATLDRAALTFCLADAFHPGCEMTWPIRHASMYMAPFRLRHRALGDPEPSFGTGANAGRRAQHRRSPVRPDSRKLVAVDGRSVADRHRQLPLWLHDGL